MGFWSRHIAPGLVDFACGAKPIAYQRRKLIPKASGVVLEIGAGGGRNFALYDREKVTQLIALEPEAGMIKRGRERAPEGLPIEWLERGAETAGLAPASVDTIVTTYTLCTIPDAVGALAALRPALKPGGQLLFCEHGLAPDPDVVKWQKRIEPRVVSPSPAAAISPATSMQCSAPPAGRSTAPNACTCPARPAGPATMSGARRSPPDARQRRLRIRRPVPDRPSLQQRAPRADALFRAASDLILHPSSLRRPGEYAPMAHDVSAGLPPACRRTALRHAHGRRCWRTCNETPRYDSGRHARVRQA